MEFIVESIVADIVTEGGHEQRKCVHIVEHGQFAQVLSLHHEVTVLRNVRSMNVIVVLNWPSVLVVNLYHELQKLIFIYFCLQSIYFNQGHSHCGHLHLSADSFRKIEDVEFKGRNGVIKLLIILQDLLDIVHGDFKIYLGGICVLPIIKIWDIFGISPISKLTVLHFFNYDKYLSSI